MRFFLTSLLAVLLLVVAGVSSLPGDLAEAALVGWRLSPLAETMGISEWIRL